MAVLTRPKTRRTHEDVGGARTHKGRGRYLIGAMCLVITSILYDEEDYIRDYDDFLRLAREAG